MNWMKGKDCMRYLYSSQNITLNTILIKIHVGFLNDSWCCISIISNVSLFLISHIHQIHIHIITQKGELIRKHNLLYSWLMWSEVCFYTSAWFKLFHQSKQFNQSLFTNQHKKVNIWFWECLKRIYWFDIHLMLSFSLFMFDLKSDNYNVIIRNS